MDKRAAEAAEFALDEPQRHRLDELRAMLGLSSPRWTAVGVLGALLAGLGWGSLNENDAFSAVLRAAKDAHRDELLAASGSSF